MKVLVTGAAGFIGSALTLRLLERGDEVVGIDNHNDYYDPALKEARLERHKCYSRYTHIRGDLADRDLIGTLFKEYKPNRVVNLAAQAGVRYSIENPLAYIDSNLLGFANVLDVNTSFPIFDENEWRIDDIEHCKNELFEYDFIRYERS